MNNHEVDEIKLLEQIGRKVGFGRACQILGEQWDDHLEKHWGLPRGRGQMERRKDIEAIEAKIAATALPVAEAIPAQALPQPMKLHFERPHGLCELTYFTAYQLIAYGQQQREEEHAHLMLSYAPLMDASAADCRIKHLTHERDLARKAATAAVERSEKAEAELEEWRHTNRIDELCRRVDRAEAALAGQAIEVEKMLCKALGREWSAAGISVESLIAAMAGRAAAPGVTRT